MKRRFNVTGSCDPQRHYMVRLDDRLKKIKEDYVDYGNYFVINRGRQYGKTTTLKALAKYLSGDYIVFSLDFQQMSTSTFADDTTFVKGFVNRLLIALKRMFFEDKEKIVERLAALKEHNDAGMDDLFECISSICELCSRPIVLIIDEVDSEHNSHMLNAFK